MLQSAVLRISSVVTPKLAAIDKEASLTLNIVPTGVMVFSHLASVEDDTGLCGLINEINS